MLTADELPVVLEDDMSRKNASESTDPLAGRLGAEIATHEGRMQTARREELAGDGKAPSDIRP